MKNASAVAVVLGCLAAGESWAQVTLPAPLETGPTADGLSPPVIIGASNCSKNDWRVAIQGGAPGAIYELYESLGNPVRYAEPIAEFQVDPNADGVTLVDVFVLGNLPDLTARIRTSTGIYSGFAVPLVRRDPSVLTRPELPIVPLWECGGATLVSGQQPGDKIELLSSATGRRAVVPSAFGVLEYVPVSNPNFKPGEIITAQYSTCEGGIQVSPLSVPAIVATYPMSVLPSPAIQAASLVVGSQRFAVEASVPGARLLVTLKRGGGAVHWSETCAATNCTAYLPSSALQLEEGDAIILSQELCAGSESASVDLEVERCGWQPAPEISPQPTQGDVLVRLSKYPLGATVRVYATKNANPQLGLSLIGHSYDTNPVPLVRPIDVDDLWVVVAVDSPGCQAVSAYGYFVGR